MGESDFRHSAEHIRLEIERKLTSCGILCRVFARGKGHNSLSSKLASVLEDGATAKYQVGKKHLQDAIGVRVVLYFSDDIEIVRRILCANYSVREESIDTPTSEEFSVTRYNLVFEMPEIHCKEMQRIIHDRPIDTTFEAQIRSVLSEGWHEVEHDLRYKQKEHWEGSDDLSRALNGIVAALETSEWGMRKIFDDLAYRHYKKKNWEAMLNLKFRMRVSLGLDERLKAIFDEDNEVAKKFLRMDRAKVMLAYSERYISIPLTLANIIYILNSIGGISERISLITPSVISRISVEDVA